MSQFRHFPVGARLPGSQHSVVVSLPTVADVIGYEERRAETMDVVRTGYPRFVRHPFIAEAGRKLAEQARVGTRALFPVASARDARRVVDFIGAVDAGVVETDGWALLHLTPNDPGLAARAGKVIQHIGVGISSRQAEDWLVANGCRAAAEAEVLFSGDALAEVRSTLAPFLAPVPPPEIRICRSGMNAVYAAFEAVRAVQRPRGRRLWIQLGWLYVDTTSVLQKCLGPDEQFVVIDNVLDQDAIEKFFTENGPRIAGVITETPTNPLLQTVNLPWLSALARRHGVRLILDPSISGVVNVNVLPFADALVTSLTKYASHQGDVLLGAVAVNPDSPDYAALRDGVRDAHAPAYARDTARLAAQIGDMAAVSGKINDNTLRLAAWLEKHPAVRRVLWAHGAETAGNYAAIARSPRSPGCMISIELKGPLARFYDRLRTAKGPSFGTVFTLVSPFIYLAHYELVTAPEGRRGLLGRGIDPELVRIGVGAESYAEIEAVFAEALG